MKMKLKKTSMTLLALGTFAGVARAMQRDPVWSRRYGYMGHEKRNRETLFPPPVPFWFERNSHFRSFNLTTLLQIQMFSPYRLSGTHPAYGCQKGTPLAIDTPRLAALRYVVRAALDSGC
ncbi:UNVERIFIED_ORG: hypothetical protein J2Y81_007761 [Paraburkholderia sediminicola]|nr:hypothetical protein [Paraburkholderia sediminicola]